MSRSEAKLHSILLARAAADHRRVVDGVDRRVLLEILARRGAVSAAGATASRAPR